MAALVGTRPIFAERRRPSQVSTKLAWAGKIGLSRFGRIGYFNASAMASDSWLAWNGF